MLALMELTVEIEVHHSSFYKMLLSAFQVKKKNCARRGDTLRYSKQIFLRMTVMRKTYATSNTAIQNPTVYSLLSSHLTQTYNIKFTFEHNRKLKQ